MSLIGGGAGATATGYLVIDASGVDKGVSQAGVSLDKITQISKNSYFGLRNIALGFEAVGDAALGVVGISAKVATTWEDSLTQMEVATYGNKAAIDANSDSIAAFNQQLKTIAENTPVPIKSIEQVGLAVSRLGVTQQQVAADTQVILDLNKTTGASFETLTDGVGKTATALGLGADGVSKLGSTLFDLQAKTSATLPDILTLFQRIVGIGAESKISAPDLLGISAAVASVGGNVRTNASALQKFIEIVQNSVTQGGPALTEFANIAGQSSVDFQKAWAVEPAKALDSVLLGIAKMNDAQGKGLQVLEQLGLGNSAQVGNLLKIAQADVAAAGTTSSLTGALAAANDVWSKGNDLQGAAKIIYGDTASAIQEAKNQIELASIGFGSLFLPAIRSAAGFVKNFAAGLQEIPGPIQGVLAIFVPLIGVLGAAGGAVLFLIPKFALARDSLIQFAVASQSAAGAEGEAAAAAEVLEAPITTLIDQFSVLIAIQLVLLGEFDTLSEALAAQDGAWGGHVAAVGAAVIADEAETESMGVLAAASVALQAALGPVGLISLGVGAALIALTTIVGKLGEAHRAAAQDAYTLYNADQQLQDAMKQEAQGTKGATDEWILNKLAMDGTLESMQLLGFSSQQTLALIKGNLPKNEVDDLTNSLHYMAASGDEVAKKTLTSLLGTAQAYNGSISATKAMAAAQKELGSTEDDTTTSIDDQNKKLETQQQLSDKAASAAANYASDKLAVKSAELQTAAALDAEAVAASNLADKSNLVLDAKQKIVVSQGQEVVAADNLRKSQQDLATAREDAQRSLDEATLQLDQDSISHVKALNDEESAQRALNKALDPTNTLIKQQEAAQSLREANNNLRDSVQGVSDAQWYVNYLMGENASARDIKDAQNNLADNQLKVEEATTKVAVANQAVKDVDPAQIALDQSNAELALRSAEDQVLATTQQLATQQETVNKLRSDVANDSAYKTALLNEKQAEEGVTSAKENTRQATLNLQALQDGSLERAYAGAVNGVESAIIQQATAMTNVTRDIEEMNGKVFTAQDYANTLATNLTKLGTTANGPVRTDIDNFAATIKSANDGPVGAFKTTTGDISKNMQTIGQNSESTISSLNKASKGIDPEGNWGKFRDLLSDIWGWLENIVTVDLNPLSKNNVLGKLAGLAERTLGNIPHGAAGGFIDTPTLALIGEAGPELLLPLSDMNRTMQLLQASGVLGAASPAISSPTSFSAAGGGTTVIHHDNRKIDQSFNAGSIIGQQALDDQIDTFFWNHRIVGRTAA